MRSFSKKLAFVLAAAMVVTAFAPAAKAEAAKEMAINKSSQILYVNEGINHKGADGVAAGKGNVSVYDFSVKNKPADWKTAYSFAWSSSDEDVVSVAKGGVATAVGVGKATVYCKVTEKATKEVTTLKTKVTVKANAYKVEITNADKWDGATVEVNGVVDLNRAMYDEDDNKTTKRGTLVTDYTKWVAEPAAGVEIDQTTGKFTFTEAAVAGEYKLSCYTYQSSKYTEKTAEADAVVVEFVKDKTFEVVQNSTKKLTLTFSQKVDALNVADVTVNKMIGDYAYTQVVKSVAVAEDGMSATVEVFNAFADAANYTVKVKDFKDSAFVASVGAPVRMVVVAQGKTPANIITTGVATALTCKLYDANDVDVTDTIAASTITYKLEKAATSGEYYLASNKLTIKKNTASVVVIANYRGKFENGKIVGALEAKETFYAVDAAAVIPVSVSAYNLDGNFNDGVTHSLQLKETKKLELKLNHSDNQNANKIYTNGSQFNNNANELITITAVTPDVADIAGEYIKPHKAGVAQFYVNYKAKQNGNWVEMPFAVIEIEVLENAIVSTVKVDNGSLLIGTADYYLLKDGSRTTDYTLNADLYETDEWGNKKVAGFSFGQTSLLGYDQRDGRTNLNSKAVTVKCLSDGYGNGVKPEDLSKYPLVSTFGDTYWDKKSDYIGIKVDGVKVRDYFASKGILTAEDNGEYITLDYEVTFKNTNGTALTTYFSVTVQEPSGNAADNYLEVKPSTTYVDITRKNDDNNKAEKVLKFEVFEKNNGVIVDTVEISKYDATTATEGAYQYKIFKDSVDITNDTNFNIEHNGKSSDYPYNQAPAVINTNKVTIHMSGTKSDANLTSVTSADALLPDYSKGGAGLYTFALYKWELVEGELIAVQQQGIDATAVLGSAGEYTIDHNAQRQNSVSAITAANILKCFTIKDTKGNNVVENVNGVDVIKTTNPYFVNYSAPEGASYVYVKEIVFYENIGGDVYLPFTVSVDVTLER